MMLWCTMATLQTITPLQRISKRESEILFMTDTEVAALLFDMLTRVYKYPIEYAIEAMAPTCERDFCLLPPEKQEIYRIIQSVHVRFSPDGPWFFIIAKNYPENELDRYN